MTAHNHSLKAREVYRDALKDRESLVRVVVLLHPDVVRDVDRWGIARGGKTRTDAIRGLLQEGLETKKAPGSRQANPDASDSE